MRLTTFFKKVLNLTSTVKSVVVETDRNDKPVVVVEVKSQRRRPRCGSCHRKCYRRHGTEKKLRMWRHLGMFGVTVQLRAEVSRVVCEWCGVRTTEVPWSRTGSVFTRQFEDEVAWFAQHTDQTATATYFGISPKPIAEVAEKRDESSKSPGFIGCRIHSETHKKELFE